MFQLKLFLVFFFCSWTTILAQDERFVAFDFVVRHEAAFDSLNTVDANIEVSLHKQTGKSSRVANSKWLKNGIDERVDESIQQMLDAHGAPLKDAIVPVVAYGFDSVGVSVMMATGVENVDELSDVSLAPGDPRYLTTKCSIAPRNPSASRPVQYWLRFSALPTSSLRELVENNEVITTKLGDESARLVIRDKDTGIHMGFDFDIEKGFLLRRTEFYSKGDNKEPVSYVEINEAKKFNNVWFPMKVTHYGPGESGDMIVTTKELSVNEPIDVERLKVKFPEGARVDEPAKGVFHVWGSKGKPVSTYHSYEEFIAAEALRGTTPVPAGGLPWWIIVVNLIGIAVIIAATILRKRLTGSSKSE